MPHDLGGKELTHGDRVVYGKVPAVVVGIDPTLCACAIESRGMVYFVPSIKLERKDAA